MHDVSEIECHARGPWMERGMKEGRDDRWSEINKREQYTKEGWRETGGLKVLGRKRDKDGKEGSSKGGISTQRQIERDYFECQCCTLSARIRAARWLLTQHTHTYKHKRIHTYTTHTHRTTCCQKTCWAPAVRWVIVSISLATTHTNKHIVLLEYCRYRHFDISLTKRRRSEASACLC